MARIEAVNLATLAKLGVNPAQSIDVLVSNRTDRPFYRVLPSLMSPSFHIGHAEGKGCWQV